MAASGAAEGAEDTDPARCSSNPGNAVDAVDPSSSPTFIRFLVVSKSKPHVSNAKPWTHHVHFFNLKP